MTIPLTSISSWPRPAKEVSVNLVFYGMTVIVNIFGLAVLISAYGI